MQATLADTRPQDQTGPKDGVYDILIVGGGINGAGIARDAAGRGLSVCLVEKDDLAQHTSSASTKLIHGGLRYLEYGEFRLVREALIERERLLAMAPHIIWPLSFVLPQINSPRPSWMVRLGLFLYDHLGGRKTLPATETISKLDKDRRGQGLKPVSAKAFVYSDCWVEDSRLVILNAMDARDRSAQILTRTRFVSAKRNAGGWTATVSNEQGDQEIRAKVLVNAAGPWVEDVVTRASRSSNERGVRLVKGSHIILPRLYEGDHAFLLQNSDRRVVFAIPYEGKFTLVGTTDIPWTDAPGPAEISPEETRYLLDTVGQFFAADTTEADIVWTYSGIRPLYDDKARNASAVTRDYVLDLDAPQGEAPLLSIFGGKITTYRKLAEHALEVLSPHLSSSGEAWTATAPLPGGDMPGADFGTFLKTLEQRHSGIPATLLKRYARAYGTKVSQILGDAKTTDDLGRHFGDSLFEAEIAYLQNQEWAQTAEDILYRRSKLGLHVGPNTMENLSAYLDQTHKNPMTETTGIAD